MRRTGIAEMVDVTNVERLDGFRLSLFFDNGVSRVLDIARLVPFDGVFEPLADPAYFRQVRVDPELGTIVWPNGADICPDVLHGAGAAAPIGRVLA